MSEQVRRLEATERTLTKYRDKSFDWKANATCLHLARFHLRNMGHKPPPLPRVKSAIGARRALIANGWDDVDDMLDTLLPRIPYARAMLGDLGVAQGDEGFGSIVICGGAKWFGWHETGGGIKPLIISELKGAWRV